MLFPYTYVSHTMEKMQDYIDFIFFEVWCKAPGTGGFQLDLFNSNAELRDLMEAFFFGDTEGGDFFYSHVESIYGLFAALTVSQIDQLRIWYVANNDIERVCANEPAINIVLYTDLAVLDPALSKQLASFYKGLYSQQLLDLAALRKKIGQIEEHYKAFREANKTGKCPFCGIGDIKGVHHSKREAYDHYLPKGLYPFNSINFRNLTPACHECNSTYKLAKDPAHNASGRRKAFYPYARVGHRIEITIDLGKCDIDRLIPDDVQLTYGPTSIHEEIDTWKEVFGIDERYRAKCCDPDAKDWLEQIRILCETLAIRPEASLAIVQQQAAIDPIANSNFLKRAFLEGCQRAGLLEAIA